MKNIGIGMVIIDNKVMSMEVLQDGNLITLCEEGVDKPMKKIEVLQALHDFIDKNMK